LEVINFYFQQTSETGQGSQATGKGNQQFNLGSSTTFATSRTTGKGFPRISASRPDFFKGLSETLALKTVYYQIRTAIFGGI